MERDENGLSPFQSHGAEEDYKEPFFDLATDTSYFKENIVNESTPGGDIHLGDGRFLHIPEGTKLQRFTRGAEARYNKEKGCYMAV